MSIVLFHGSGSGDFELQSLQAAGGFAEVRSNVSNLLRARGDKLALDLLARYPFELLPASNHFNDEFHVLHAFVSLSLYEEARSQRTVGDNKRAFARIAETFAELGPTCDS